MVVLVEDQVEAAVLKIIPSLECLYISVWLWGYSFVPFEICRPPDAAPEFSHELSCIMNKYLRNKVILVGDFNLPGIDWGHLDSGLHHNRDVDILFDFMLTHDLAQAAVEPTRVQSSSSVLDLVFFAREFVEFMVVVEPGLSDRYLVYISLLLTSCRKTDKSCAHSAKHSRAMTHV